MESPVFEDRTYEFGEDWFGDVNFEEEEIRFVDEFEDEPIPEEQPLVSSYADTQRSSLQGSYYAGGKEQRGTRSLAEESIAQVAQTLAKIDNIRKYGGTAHFVDKFEELYPKLNAQIRALDVLALALVFQSIPEEDMSLQEFAKKYGRGTKNDAADIARYVRFLERIK